MDHLHKELAIPENKNRSHQRLPMISSGKTFNHRTVTQPQDVDEEISTTNPYPRTLTVKVADELVLSACGRFKKLSDFNQKRIQKLTSPKTEISNNTTTEKTAEEKLIFKWFDFGVYLGIPIEELQELAKRKLDNHFHAVLVVAYDKHILSPLRFLRAIGYTFSPGYARTAAVTCGVKARQDSQCIFDAPEDKKMPCDILTGQLDDPMPITDLLRHYNAIFPLYFMIQAGLPAKHCKYVAEGMRSGCFPENHARYHALEALRNHNLLTFRNVLKTLLATGAPYIATKICEEYKIDISEVEKEPHPGQQQEIGAYAPLSIKDLFFLIETSTHCNKINFIKRLHPDCPSLANFKIDHRSSVCYKLLHKTKYGSEPLNITNLANATACNSIDKLVVSRDLLDLLKEHYAPTISHKKIIPDSKNASLKTFPDPD